MGEVFRERLAGLAERHPSIGDVRGLGCFWGIELVRNRETREMLVPFNATGEDFAPVARVAKAAAERGLYLMTHWNVVIVAPPLTITREELRRGRGRPRRGARDRRRVRRLASRRPMSELPAGTVTFLFTDIEGSTELTRQLGERWPDVHAEHRRRVRGAAADADGREVDTQGDSFFFVFARARHALAAAANAQRALAEPWPEDATVAVRMGIHTGEPAIGEEGYLGLDVVRGARIASLARGGQVLVSETTRALVRGDDLGGLELRDLGERELKGLGEPERVFDLVVPGLEPPLPAPADDEPAFPVAGREQELAARALSLVPDLSTIDEIGPRIEREVQETLKKAGVPGWVSTPGVSTPEAPRSSESKLARLVVIGFAALFLLLAFVVAVILLLRVL